jgi:hypothetical protein
MVIVRTACFSIKKHSILPLGGRPGYTFYMFLFFIYDILNQTGSGVHPTSYPMGTGGSFPGSKAAGA